MVDGTRWRRRAMAGVAVASGGLLASSLSSLSFPLTVQGSSSHCTALCRRNPNRKTVHLLMEGRQKEWSSRKGTVAEALAEAGVKLGPKDEIYPDLEQPLWDGMPIYVCRVRTVVVARDQKIPYGSQFQPTLSRWRRLPVIVRRGKPGLRRKRYEIVFRDGQEAERNLISITTLRPTISQLITAPPRYQLASRGYYGGRRVFRMIATAYDPGPGSCGPQASGRTAIGMRAGHGVVAVDPAIIPMNARVYVEGYGYAVAADIGSAIKGNRIDLGFRNRSQALHYGRHAVVVWVLD